ncbi:MAG: pentapeptide repeat-containing protein [Deltaproteobacteria bacterium]|nr:pentapeptide repeat-containing protein [Deltaproteobacteria bacterium]
MRISFHILALMTAGIFFWSAPTAHAQPPEDRTSVAAPESSATPEGIWIEKKVGEISVCIDLEKTLEEHRIWLQTYRAAFAAGKQVRHISGEQADLSHAMLNGADLSGTNLSFAQLSFADLSHAKLSKPKRWKGERYYNNQEMVYLWNKYLSKDSLWKANLSNAELWEAKLTRAKMNDDERPDSVLSGVDLSHANLTYANLSYASLEGACLSQAVLREAELPNADLERADLTKAILQNANLSGTFLWRANLSSAYIVSANLSSAYLKGANVSHALLSRANLSYAILAGADLSYANLWLANLSNANLSHANLSHANLSHADLSHANLSHAKLKDAKLKDANLKDAHFKDADLSHLLFEPRPGSLPDLLSISTAKNIHLLRFRLLYALVELREAFKKAGFRDQERAVTYALKHGEMINKLNELYLDTDLLNLNPPYEYLSKLSDDILKYPLAGRKNDIPFSKFIWEHAGAWAKFWMFEATCDWGMSPLRPVVILLVFIPIFFWGYLTAIFLGEENGIWVVWHPDRVNLDMGVEYPKMLVWRKWGVLESGRMFGIWQAIFFAFYFSILSAFNINWRGLKVGTWIRQMQRHEYSLRASGWTRVLSGVQSIISVYLLALSVLSYFGRPFEW